MISLLVLTAAAGRCQERPTSKIVIAHRGASGYLPEHTLAAYALAHGMGADFIEPDLVMTRDGKLVCVHDIHLDSTTDVDQVFPDRKRADGHWYAADLTLEEVRRLAVHERLGQRFPQTSVARFSVPTFAEMIELVQGLNRTTGRTAGIYPELKEPAWHREAGLPMEEAFLELVGRYGYEGPRAAIFVQCFEPATLERLRALGSKLPQVLLIGDERGAQQTTDDALALAVGYANGIGPSKSLLEADPEIVARAHRRGLVVHPYTFRADDLPPPYKTLEDELKRFYSELGVDGLFTDFPDRARRFLDRPAG